MSFFQLDQILKTNCSIRLKTADSIFMKLNTDDIYFIQAFGRNMLFSTKHGEVCSRQYTMKSLDEILPDHFERCHKSFLVNTKYIHSVNPKERTLHIKEIDDDIPYGKDFHLE
ncbi:LytTR family transcriptional regulator [Clostridium sp. OM07-10AC]|nr:LytTR family transcriptional regulator [Clostridium sp. OM07-10AC]